jgi:alkylhydroperoxidase family enzyme
MVVRTLARRGDLLAPWITLGSAVLAGDLLSRSDAELVVLRIAYRTGSVYEWANHAVAAQLAGMSGDEIRAIADDDATWPPRQTVLLAAADELYGDDAITDQTWAELERELGEGGAIQLLMLAGFYRMTAGVLNGLGVQPEDGRPDFGSAPADSTPAGGVDQPVSSSATVDGDPDGAWDITLRHPAGDQQLVLTLKRDGDAIEGTVTNVALGLTIPLTDGHADHNSFSGTSSITTPIALTQIWRGAVSGDRVTGQCEVSGMGSFPFDGHRADDRS